MFGLGSIAVGTAVVGLSACGRQNCGSLWAPFVDPERRVDVLWAPLIEEACKMAISYVSGVGRDVVGVAFGLSEFGPRVRADGWGKAAASAPALFMHCLVGRMHPAVGLAYHVFTNWGICVSRSSLYPAHMAAPRPGSDRKNKPAGRGKRAKPPRQVSNSARVQSSVSDSVQHLRGDVDALREMVRDAQEQANVAWSVEHSEVNLPEADMGVQGPPEFHEDWQVVVRHETSTNYHPRPHTFVVQTIATDKKVWWAPYAAGIVAALGLAGFTLALGKRPSASLCAFAYTATAATTYLLPRVLQRCWRRIMPVSAIISEVSSYTLEESKMVGEVSRRSLREEFFGAVDYMAQEAMVRLGSRDFRDTAVIVSERLMNDMQSHEWDGADTRLTNVRANPAVTDSTALHRVVICPLHDVFDTSIYETPEMTNQTLVSLLKMKPEDRAKVAYDFASRVTNIMVPGAMAPDVIKGSAILSLLLASTHDVTTKQALKVTPENGTGGWHSSFTAMATGTLMVLPPLLAATILRRSSSSSLTAMWYLGALSRWRSDSRCAA